MKSAGMLLTVVGLILGLFCFSQPADAASSTNYSITRATFTGGGGAGGSTNYETFASVGHEIYIGYMTSEITPSYPELAVREWLHFTTTIGPDEQWSFVSSDSGGTIDQDNGIYQAGGTTGTDVVMASVIGDSATTDATVTATSRDPGIIGPATSMDVDGGGVSVADVIFMLKCVVGSETPTAQQTKAGDFDCNGSIGLADVMNALRIVVALDPLL